MLSIIKNNFRDEFRGALLSGGINVTFYVMFVLFALIMVWIISLIRPLDAIKNYINKLKICCSLV